MEKKRKTIIIDQLIKNIGNINDEDMIAFAKIYWDAFNMLNLEIDLKKRKKADRRKYLAEIKKFLK